MTPPMCDRKKLRAFIYLVLIVFAFGPVPSRSQLSESPPRGIESHNGKARLQDLAAIPPSEQQTTPQTSAQWPQLVDITASTGIKFEHLSSPEQKYIVESMSGGVALIDYDRDGWPDIYFTNAQSVEIALAGKKARSALYHNNHDGTFTDVTEKAGVGYPCWAMGAVVGVSRDLPTTFATTRVTAHLPMYRRRRGWMIHKTVLDSRWCGQTLTTMAVLTSSSRTMDSPTIFTVTTATDTLPRLPICRAWPSTRMEPSKPTWALRSVIISTPDFLLS